MPHVASQTRRTKIVATLGPATDSEESMSQIIMAGVDVVRLNFSHGLHEEHKGRIELVRRVAEKCCKIVGILADLQGPKIRIASFKNKKVELKEGDAFILDAKLDENAGDEHQVGIDYKELTQDVGPHDILLLDDGRIMFSVEKVEASKIYCRVEVGGELSSHKGINRQGGGLSAKALTEKDKHDMQFALAMGVDYIAISFPRNAEDINEARSLMDQMSGKAAIIAKIERAEAMKAIDEIIEASDGVMVARGDLAVEIGDAEVPVAQKKIIHEARAKNKPVITATQMMESMITSSVPTRAEVSDVANAVLDNTDAVMLSAETAVGEHPAKVVAAMARVCLVAEQQPNAQLSRHRVECVFERIDEAIAMATMYTANHLDIAAIVTLTESGTTPLWMSRIRTGIPIYALSRSIKTLGRMTLWRGVYPIAFDVTAYSRDEVNIEAIKTLENLKVVQIGEKVILTKGDYAGVGGGSNAMKILVVGKVL